MSFSNFPNALFQDSILNGRYIIKDVLGQGGFGITYKALDYQTREYVAIKEYYPRMIVTRDPSYNVVPQTGQNDHDFDYGRSQFLEEAKTLSEFIGNPGVVKVYSYFEENGTAYFVMEYLEGVSLSEYLRKKGGRIPWQEAWELMLPLMDALSAVHEKKIVHRDIKPDNIIITDDGLTKLLDFGAARYVYGVQSHSLDTVLTPGFAPFEQYFRRGNQGPWTDVYALAATMYCAITGAVPPESAERSYKDTLVPPSSLGTALPGYAEAAILKALAVHEDNRYRDMDGFKSAVLDGIRREEEEKRKKEEEGLRRREEKSREEEEKQREQKEEHLREEGEKGDRGLDNDKPGNGPQPWKKDDNGRQQAGTKKTGDPKAPSPVPPKKRASGSSIRIILAMGLIALIVAAGSVILNGKSGQPSGTGTDSIEQITERSDNTGGQDDPSAQEEKGEKEEEEPVQISRPSDAPMELTDSWEEIAAAGHDGTYKERYRIGDTKELDMGSEGVIIMKLVAMDEDELADGSGKAPMTWVADELLKSKHKMNSEWSREGGWEASEMRAWLRETVLPLMPEEVRRNIREVTKYSYSYEEQKGVASKDTIWIPSGREVFLSDQSDWVNEYKEQEGVSYTSVFTDNKSRERSRDGESGASWWWLRSAINITSSDFYFVKSDGDYNYGYFADREGGVVVGFCF